MRIHQLTSPALGDAWGTLNRCLEIALELSEPVGISRWWQYAGVRHDVTAKLREFMPLLPLEGKVVATAEMADQPHFDYGEALQSHRFPTNPIWRPSYSRVVCHQFDSRSQAHLATPTADQLRRFHDRLREREFEPVDLGHDRPLADCVPQLAACHAYVGLCSGMSQVAISVGAPLHVVRNEVPLGGFYGVFDRRQGRAYRTLDEVDVSDLERVDVIRWADRLKPDA
ncbi:MAG TPA: hypothetical protein VF278_17600 [Pirellulales bacterium]